MIESARLTKFAYWAHGVRLYIGIGIAMVTAEACGWALAVYGWSTAAATRLEEIYAWLAVALLVFALGIGPVYKLFPRLGGRMIVRDARRLIGVGAAWFASLHVAIVYGAQFAAANPRVLPGAYQRSFVIGLVALLALVILAGTSFDGAMRRLGAWWFRLHRLVYLAAFCILLHTFIVGVHATRTAVFVLLALVSFAIVAMHARIARSMRPVSAWQTVTLVGSVIALVLIFNYGYGQYSGYNLLGQRQHTGHHHR